MGQAKPDNGYRSNQPAINAGTFDAQSVHLNEVIAECAKSVFVKPFSALMHFLQLSESGAKKKIGGRRAFSASELALLIRTEEGFHFITAIMADTPAPSWWRLCEPVMEAAEGRKMQIVARKRMARAVRAAIDADQDLSAAIVRAEAVAVQDEDHMRPHLDALRAMARVPRGPVASKSRR